MAWDARTTYYYLVCFVTLLMVIFGTVRVVQHGLDLLLPEEPYRPSPVELRERTLRPPGQADTTFTREELEEMAEEEAARQRRQQRAAPCGAFWGASSWFSSPRPSTGTTGAACDGMSRSAGERGYG